MPLKPRPWDGVISGLGLALALAVFAWVNAAVLAQGVSSADDAWYALSARSLAAGDGYGTPRSSEQFIPFHPNLALGPALILPGALLIALFGPLDGLPGATSLFVFLLQLAGAASLLQRRHGWPATGGFLAVSLALLCVASARHWYFGVFVGESVAFGDLLLGAAALDSARRDRGFAAAALCFSAAVLTKMIALFAVAGILAAWLVASRAERVAPRLLARRAAILALVGSAPALAFEAAKLALLGAGGYRALLSDRFRFVAELGVGASGIGERLSTFWTVLESFLPTGFLLAMTGGALALGGALARRAPAGGARLGRLGLYLAAGGVAHVAYFLLVSTLHDRYLWIGLALLICAAAAPLLAVAPAARAAAIVATVLLLAILRLDQPIRRMRAAIATNSAAGERAAVARFLDDHSDVPFAAEYWSSLYDVVYVKAGPGTWYFGPDVTKLRHREFFALINDLFTGKASAFHRVVTAACSPLTPGARRIRIFHCDESFWTEYE